VEGERGVRAGGGRCVIFGSGYLFAVMLSIVVPWQPCSATSSAVVLGQLRPPISLRVLQVFSMVLSLVGSFHDLGVLSFGLSGYMMEVYGRLWIFGSAEAMNCYTLVPSP
jgi:hypothetical protein